MDDIFSKMVSIILIVILLCVVPAFYVSLYTDLSRYLYLNNRITSLIDEVIYTGVIRDDELLHNDDFELTLQRNVYIPEDNEMKCLALTKNTINEQIKNNSIYKFEQGDIVTAFLVDNKNLSNTFLDKIFNIKNNVNYITYTGVVKNECY